MKKSVKSKNKLGRNFWIPFIIISLTFIFILIDGAPVFLVVLVYLFLITMVFVQTNYKKDWGEMFGIGIISSICFVVFLMVILSLANKYDIISKIVFGQ